MKRITILIADDHAVVREGLRTLISSQNDLELIGEAENGIDAVQLAKKCKPDVILIDIVMPKMDGVNAIGEIKKLNPDARILVLTSFADDDKVFPAIKAGALGYLLKDSSPKELISAIHDVYQGKPSLHPNIALMLFEELNQPTTLPPTDHPLTEREVTILKLVAQGLTNQEIADALVISELTVRTHVSNILAKLHLANRTQAALYALRKGIARIDDS